MRKQKFRSLDDDRLYLAMSFGFPARSKNLALLIQWKREKEREGNKSNTRKKYIFSIKQRIHSNCGSIGAQNITVDVKRYYYSVSHFVSMINRKIEKNCSYYKSKGLAIESILEFKACFHLSFHFPFSRGAEGVCLNKYLPIQPIMQIAPPPEFGQFT